MPQAEKKTHRILKAVGSAIAVLGIVGGSAYYIAGNGFYHHDSENTKLLDSLNVTEKEYTFADGSVLAYAELGSDDSTPLLLLHGQTVSWEDYAKVLPSLSEQFHVFAVDYYGHGGSSKNPEKYSAQAIGSDLTEFIQGVVGEPCIVSGHSSGGLLTVWLAAYAQDDILGIVVEDAPFFTGSTPGRYEMTYAYLDGFKPIHEFLNQTTEDNYTRYWLSHNYVQTLWRGGWDSMVKQPFLKAIEKNPGRVPRIRKLPGATMNKAVSLTANMQDGTGDYDLRFGDTFYDGSWYAGFDEAEALARIECPAILLHTAPGYGNSYYDESGVLLGACDHDDIARAHTLLAGSELIDGIKTGHDIHDEKPGILVDALIDVNST